MRLFGLAVIGVGRTGLAVVRRLAMIVVRLAVIGGVLPTRGRGSQEGE